MSTNPKNVDQAIADFENLRDRYQAKEAVKRLQEAFERAFADDNPHSVRNLIEKTHLICGDRRVRNLSVAVDQRRQDDD